MSEEKVEYKSLADYQKYFVLDDNTGDLFVRSDFIERMKDLKGKKVWLLLKIMSFWPDEDDDLKEHLNDIKNFEGGETEYYLTRKEYRKQRDALMVALINRDGYYCQICGSENDITIDHITPVIKGGKNYLSNLQLLCRSCNSMKGIK